MIKSKVREFFMLKSARKLYIECLLHGFSVKLDRNGFFVATLLETVGRYRIDLTCRYARDLKGNVRIEICVNQQFIELEPIESFSVPKLLEMPFVKKSRGGAVVRS